MHHKGGFQRWKELITFPFEKFTVYQQTKKKNQPQKKKTLHLNISVPQKGSVEKCPMFFSFPCKTAQNGLMVGLDYLSALSNLNDATSLQKEQNLSYLDYCRFLSKIFYTFLGRFGPGESSHTFLTPVGS